MRCAPQQPLLPVVLKFAPLSSGHSRLSWHLNPSSHTHNAQGVLAGLESSYYSSSHKGRLQGPEASLALEQLQQLSDK